jgi:hypothetical protein
MEVRLKETLRIMRDLYDLGIPPEYPPMREVSKRMTHFVRTGDPYFGSIKFHAYDRVAEIQLPRQGTASVRLRKMESRDK